MWKWTYSLYKRCVGKHPVVWWCQGRTRRSQLNLNASIFAVQSTQRGFPSARCPAGSVPCALVRMAVKLMQLKVEVQSHFINSSVHSRVVQVGLLRCLDFNPTQQHLWADLKRSVGSPHTVCVNCSARRIGENFQTHWREGSTDLKKHSYCGYYSSLLQAPI